MSSWRDVTLAVWLDRLKGLPRGAKRRGNPHTESIGIRSPEPYPGCHPIRPKQDSPAPKSRSRASGVIGGGFFGKEEDEATPRWSGRPPSHQSFRSLGTSETMVLTSASVILPLAKARLILTFPPFHIITVTSASLAI